MRSFISLGRAIHDSAIFNGYDSRRLRQSSTLAKAGAFSDPCNERSERRGAARRVTKIRIPDLLSASSGARWLPIQGRSRFLVVSVSGIESHSAPHLASRPDRPELLEVEENSLTPPSRHCLGEIRTSQPGTDPRTGCRHRQAPLLTGRQVTDGGCGRRREKYGRWGGKRKKQASTASAGTRERTDPAQRRNRADRQTGRQASRQGTPQTDRQAGRQTGTQAQSQANRVLRFPSFRSSARVASGTNSAPAGGEKRGEVWRDETRASGSEPRVL